MTLDGWMTRTTDNSAGDNIPNPEIVALAVQFNDPDLLPKAKTKTRTRLKSSTKVGTIIVYKKNYFSLKKKKSCIPRRFFGNHILLQQWLKLNRDFTVNEISKQTSNQILKKEKSIL